MEDCKKYETPQGPQKASLGEMESRLPAALQKKGTAVLFALVMILAAVLLLGGVKLKGQYSKVEKLYTEGKSISYDLQFRQDAAANIITVGGQVLGREDELVQNAQASLEALMEARENEGPAAQFDADSALGKTVDMLYQTLKSSGLEDSKATALQTQWSEFLSRADLIGHSDYNEQARRYNKTASGIPAGLLAGLWGCGEVELFA